MENGNNSTTRWWSQNRMFSFFPSYEVSRFQLVHCEWWIKQKPLHLSKLAPVWANTQFNYEPTKYIVIPPTDLLK